MVAQLKAPARLDPLLPPAIPPADAKHMLGYRRNAGEAWEPTDSGLETAAMAQRILLSYALELETRAELAARYCLGLTQVQSTVAGRAHYWLTLPIRQRLLALGIGSRKMARSAARPKELLAALQKLAGEASVMMLWPEHYYPADLERVQTDLWLLSGAWWEPRA